MGVWRKLQIMMLHCFCGQIKKEELGWTCSTPGEDDSAILLVAKHKHLVHKGGRMKRVLRWDNCVRI